MKIYRRHNCQDRHSTWPDLAACIWPRARVDGDGPYAAASCGARVITLYTSLGQARARTYDYDRDTCRPECRRHHNVIALDPAVPPSPASPVTRHATTPATPVAEAEQSICGRPRTNGEPCRRPAGWGADPGQVACRDHGGTTVVREAEAERVTEQALTLARLAAKARTTPLTAEERQHAEAAARGVLSGRRPSEVAVSGLAGWPFCSSVVEVPEMAVPSMGLLVGLLSRRLDGEVS